MFRVHILKEKRSTNVWRWLCDHSRYFFFIFRAVLTHKVMSPVFALAPCHLFTYS
jgi:hypothetical protein